MLTAAPLLSFTVEAYGTIAPGQIFFTFRCGAHTEVCSFPMSASDFKDGDAMRRWMRAMKEMLGEELPRALLDQASVATAQVVRKVSTQAGMAKLTPNDYKAADLSHQRFLKSEAKKRGLVGGRGRRPAWSKEELERATRKAAALIYRKKKYAAPSLDDIAAVFNKRFPDRGIFTANSVRQLLNRNGISWRVLWREIENAQKSA